MLSKKMSKPYMISTFDNPWNPFNDYNQWRVWDEEHQYYTESTLGRLSLSFIKDLENDEDCEQARALAIQTMLETNLGEMYVKVYQEDKTPILDADDLSV